MTNEEPTDIVAKCQKTSKQMKHMKSWRPHLANGRQEASDPSPPPVIVKNFPSEEDSVGATQPFLRLCATISGAADDSHNKNGFKAALKEAIPDIHFPKDLQVHFYQMGLKVGENQFFAKVFLILLILLWSL